MERKTAETLDLFLCGKSSPEKEIATLLHNKQCLKLSDASQLIIRLQSQLPRRAISFNVNSFFNSLSTSRFARFLMWSPCLPSTHDVVSQYAIHTPFYLLYTAIPFHYFYFCVLFQSVIILGFTGISRTFLLELFVLLMFNLKAEVWFSSLFNSYFILLSYNFL